MMILPISHLLALAYLLLYTGILRSAVADDVCLADGVCFASKAEAHEYYYNGVIVPIDFGEDQSIAGKDWKEGLDNIEKAKKYMKEVVIGPEFDGVRKGCVIRNKLCSFWAAMGECDVNPSYMKLQCAPSCQTCEQLSFDKRCPYNKDAPTALNPGDLNKMFESIVSDERYKERLTVFSQPPSGPWIVTLDDFLTPEECQRLIDLGSQRGYERSKDVGKEKFDGTYDSVESKSRTSSNAWCVDECDKDDTTRRVMSRIQNVTGIPEENYEYLQLLQYHETQFYGSHHDYIAHHQQRPQGVRILTVFLYLNDVEAGGGTRFTDLDIIVAPKTGRVLIWPSTLDSDPNNKDRKTHHEAMPVIKGIKYGANAWLHQRNFKDPHSKGCV